MKTILLKLSLTALLMGALPGPAAAARAPTDLPAGTPTRFEEVGTVDDINLESGKIVVGDVVYSVTAATPVVLQDGRTGSIKSLQKGTWVGLATIPAAKGRATAILRIWVLPKDYAPPQED